MTKNQVPRLEKHIFSLFSSQQFGYLKTAENFSLNNDELYRRLYKILRLGPGQEVILFDGKQQATIVLSQSNKKGLVEGYIKNLLATKTLYPRIDLYIGLTKKDAFKEIVYFAAQMGVSSIIPLLTEKTQRSWGNDKEKEKLEKIMLSACEQAKQFIIPSLSSPISMCQALKNTNGITLFFEAHGKPLLPFIQKKTDVLQSLSLFIGCEGGLTEREQDRLKKAGAHCYKLTPMTLRSQEAVVVILGIIRTLIS